MLARTTICLLVCTSYLALADVDIITEPRPGEEFVLVSSGQQTPIRNFETSHKIPEKHPQQHVVRPDDGPEKVIKKYHSVKSAVRQPTEGIVAIEEEKRVLHKKPYKGKVTDSVEIDIPVSKIEDIKIKDIKNVETNPKMAVALEAMSESGKLSDGEGTTTQKPVLTTSRSATTSSYDYIPINFDSIDDINAGLLSSNVKLETAGSEQKQHSRIQVKKGPNGQDYEYEYIYYYYDDEEGAKGGKGKSSTAEPVHNAHDGPQKAETDNHIAKEAKGRSKYSSIDRSGSSTSSSVTPATENEVLPTAARGRARGRTISPAPVNEEVVEDRLPSSTRFPPRGRNLGSTTPLPEASSEAAKLRSRQSDNVADESIGQTRSRTRSHVRRPSSELVDLDSFKPHSGDIPSQYKELPSRYSSEKTTTEVAETNESPREGHSIKSAVRLQELVDDSKQQADFKTTTSAEQDTTEFTTMTAMEKVALDLYAYLAGVNLNNEINPTVDDALLDGSTTVEDDTFTTEAMSTTEEPTTTTAATTTTTTTTTPAPTSTAAPAPSTRPSRFKIRTGARGRASSTTSTTTEPPAETSTKLRGRFNKPGTGRRTTAAASSTTASDSTSTTAAPQEKASESHKAFGRRGLFAGRTRPVSSTTQAPGDASTEASVQPPRMIHRPALRRLGSSSTVAPASTEGEAPSADPSQEHVETTTAPARTIGRRPGLRPLRPGPRLNLSRPPSRNNLETISESPAGTSSSSASEAPNTEADTSESVSTAAPAVPQRGLKLRHPHIQPSAKPRAPVTQIPRRLNPLLRRKQPTTEATTEAAKAPEEEEATTVAEKSVTSEAEEPSTETTTAAPLRGLDALYARRRAAQASRIPRPAKRSA